MPDTDDREGYCVSGDGILLPPGKRSSKQDMMVAAGMKVKTQGKKSTMAQLFVFFEFKLHVGVILNTSSLFLLICVSLEAGIINLISLMKINGTFY